MGGNAFLVTDTCTSLQRKQTLARTGCRSRMGAPRRAGGARLEFYLYVKVDGPRGVASEKNVNPPRGRWRLFSRAWP